MSEESLEKQCKRCFATKGLAEFHKQPSGPMGRHSWCRPCANAYAKVTRLKVTKPEDKFRWNLKTKYGITPETLQAMREAQQGKCGICDQPMKRECIDHCHETGRVRGLLCHRCNLLLAGVEDREFRAKALAYLSSTEAFLVSRSASPARG